MKVITAALLLFGWSLFLIGSIASYFCLVGDINILGKSPPSVPPIKVELYGELYVLKVSPKISSVIEELINATKEIDEQLKEQKRCTKKIANSSSTIVNPYNVAICSFGQLRYSKLMHKRFENYVWDPLEQPDLFLYLKLHADADRNFTTAESQLVRLAKKAVLFTADIDFRLVKAKNPNYCKCLDEYGGNWNSGWPGSEFPQTGVMHQLYGAYRCGSLIREAEKARGRLYDRIIFTRSDFIYAAAHPPLEKLNPKFTWIPKANDWFGYYDRHVIMPRKDANVRFDVYEQLINGSFNCTGALFGVRNAEIFQYSLFTRNGIRVERYPAVSYLGCPDRYFHTWSPCLKGYFDHKYADEYTHVLKNLKQHGLVWSAQELISRSRRAANICHAPN